MNQIKNYSISTLCMLLFSVYSFAQPSVTAPKPYGPVPNKNQYTWQQMEYYMFIHFGPNTFTDKEWGQGDEDPKVFNPRKLDARQWARTAKAAGMKAIIITAKHHDGFCLFPSKYSTHTVRESSWKSGKGDVLKELSDACREYELKFGVYLSPWDRNHPDYGTPRYNDVFANTLKEVLSNYGNVFEQWFDGANGGEKKQVYDWAKFYGVVRKNQPQAVIFSDIGPDIRWMGNEKGVAGQTNWSTLNTDGFEVGPNAPGVKILNTGNENGKYWIPAEVDVSIRPGWFYSPSTDDKVKTLEQLESIYNTSVGRNSNLLLNVPVDRDGLIHRADSTRLMELRRYLDATYKTDLAKGKKVSASNVRGKAGAYAGQNLTDGKAETFWATDDRVTNASVIIELDRLTELNRIVLQEDIRYGQRIKSFSVEYWNGSGFKPLDEQTTIGYKRILVFPNVKTTRIRVNVLDAYVCPVLSSVQLYKAPDM